MSMSYLLGKLNLRAFRYCVLATFLVCNALIASLAVWNLGLVRGFESVSVDRSSLLGLDSYLTFLGCSGLALFFVVGFVEISRKSCFLANVWFECLWVSSWGLMYLAAGIGLTIVASREDCGTAGSSLKCVSTQVLLAFTWLCTISLLVYLSTFIFAVFINKKKDATIWQSTMRKFPWDGTCAILASSPPTPTLPRFQNTVPIIHAPKPKRAHPNPTKRSSIFSWRSGLSHEYQIEHYRPTTVQVGTSQAASPPRAAAPPVVRAPALPPIEADMPESNFASSLYPMYMQQTAINANSEPALPELALNSVSMSATVQVPRAPTRAALPPSPPPLGNWPRADIISRTPSKGKRRTPPIPRGDFSGVSEVLPSPSGSRTRPERADMSDGQSTAPSSFTLMRPIGPRRRSGSSDMTTRPSAQDSQRFEYA